MAPRVRVACARQVGHSERVSSSISSEQGRLPRGEYVILIRTADIHGNPLHATSLAHLLPPPWQDRGLPLTNRRKRRLKEGKSFAQGRRVCGHSGFLTPQSSSLPPECHDTSEVLEGRQGH